MCFGVALWFVALMLYGGLYGGSTGLSGAASLVLLRLGCSAWF